MNPKIKGGLSLLFIILGAAWAGFSSFDLSFFEGSEPETPVGPAFFKTFEIESIEITYEAQCFCLDPHIFRFYTVKNVEGTYYTNMGDLVDPEIIRFFAESLTDFYESFAYEDSCGDLFMTDYYPHFTVVVTLTNEETLVLKSDSNYYCFIPWNIEYKGKSYVQYNGKIPSALLRIFSVADKEMWSFYDKEIRWGCYPALVPERYSGKLSSDFPQTGTVMTPEEELGNSHLLWKIALPDYNIGTPVYNEGKVYIAVKDRLLSYDALTGEKKWEFPFETEKEVPGFLMTENIASYEGKVYCSSPDSCIYALDGETGALLWKYRTNGKWHFPLKVRGDTILGLTGGITCLKRETGELMWEIMDDTWNEEFYEDRILFSGRNGDESYCALANYEGEILWKETDSTISSPHYSEGVLYFSRPRERILFSLDVESGRQEWSYVYENTLRYYKVFRDGVLLVLSDEENKFLDSLVLLDRKGRTVWEYEYPAQSRKILGYEVDVLVSSGNIFHVEEGGIIDAFDEKTGEKLWETEVRGTEIESFQVYGGHVYVCANDGRVYCLKIWNGDTAWMQVTENVVVYPENEIAWPSLMEDGLFFVATLGGNLYAFSA